MLNDTDLGELLASGLTEKQAHATGHFSANRDWVKAHLGTDHEGLVFAYKNIYGTPYTFGNKPFYRIKPRDWTDIEDPPKYLSPKGAGNKPYFSALTKNILKLTSEPSHPIILTEGEKKCDSLNAHGFFAVGLSGVYGWLDKTTREDEEEVKESRMIPELQNSIEWKGRRAYIAFDSDIVSKPQVKAAMKDLAVALKALGATPYVIRIPNEINGDKNGADDFIIRHGSKCFNLLIDTASPALTSKGALKFSEPSTINKIYLSYCVLKDYWRYRPGIGYYHWEINHWVSRTPEEFERDLVLFQDAQRWRIPSYFDTILRQLRSRLLISESFWNPDHKLNFKNGSLDCTTGVFVETHSKTDFCTHCLDYNYDPAATCPKWIDFLMESLGNDDAAVELIRAFIRWILHPKSSIHSHEIQKGLDIVGRKGSGKGTFLDIITELVGRSNYAAISTDTFNSQNYLASMLDKKVSIDFDAHGLLKDVGAFNKVISNEPIQVRYLYENPVEVRLKTTVIRAYNQYLDVSSGNEGLERRVIAISFSNRPKKIDLELSDKLRRELPGIFSWAWSMSMPEAKKIIMEAGRIASVKEASAELFEANNPEYVFLTECFPNGKERIKASDLYQFYSKWAKDSGCFPTKKRKFFETIQRIDGCQKSPKSNGCFYYSIPMMERFDVAGHIGLSSIDTDPLTQEPPSVEPEAPGVEPEPPEVEPEAPGVEPEPPEVEPEAPGIEPEPPEVEPEAPGVEPEPPEVEPEPLDLESGIWKPIEIKDELVPGSRIRRKSSETSPNSIWHYATVLEPPSEYSVKVNYDKLGKQATSFVNLSRISELQIKRRPQGGDRVRPKVAIVRVNRPATITYVAKNFIDVKYDDGSNTTLGMGDWEFLPKAEDPAIRAKAVYEKLCFNAKIKIGKHKLHRGFTGKIAYVEKKFEGFDGRLYVRAFCNDTNGADEDKLIDFLCEAIELPIPRSGDQILYKGYSGFVEKVREKRLAIIQWDASSRKLPEELPPTNIPIDQLVVKG